MCPNPNNTLGHHEFSISPVNVNAFKLLSKPFSLLVFPSHPPRRLQPERALQHHLRQHRLQPALLLLRCHRHAALLGRCRLRPLLRPVRHRHSRHHPGVRGGAAAPPPGLPRWLPGSEVLQQLPKRGKTLLLLSRGQVSNRLACLGDMLNHYRLCYLQKKLR